MIWNERFWISDTDPEVLKSRYQGYLKEAGFDILDSVEHHFKPYGYTALFLLGESHLAIHTFPEENKTYIEISSCVKDMFDNFNSIAKQERQTKWQEEKHYQRN